MYVYIPSYYPPTTHHGVSLALNDYVICFLKQYLECTEWVEVYKQKLSNVRLTFYVGDQSKVDYNSKTLNILSQKDKFYHVCTCKCV